MKPCTMSTVVDRRRYSTTSATLLAGDDYWDGHNYERHGRQTYLYRTPAGRYFATHLTQWQDEQDRIEALALDATIALYEGLTEQRQPFAEAFPGVEVEEG